jgi:hypothetical protein
MSTPKTPGGPKRVCEKSHGLVYDAENDSIEMGPYKMSAGTYYVGDLCYVLNDKAWKEVFELSKTREAEFAAQGKTAESKYASEGKFTLSDGREVVLFHMPDGDGCYTDSKGRGYSVDSGTIGMTMADGLEEAFDIDDSMDAKLLKRVKGLGHLIKYKTKFSCFNINAPLPEGNGRVACFCLGNKTEINSIDQEFSIGNFIRQGLAKEAADAGVESGGSCERKNKRVCV